MLSEAVVRSKLSSLIDEYVSSRVKRGTFNLQHVGWETIWFNEECFCNTPYESKEADAVLKVLVWILEDKLPDGLISNE